MEAEPGPIYRRKAGLAHEASWIEVAHGSNPMQQRLFPPTCDYGAPVKAHFARPNGSDSARDSVIAPQLTAANGPVLPVRPYISRPATSLPVRVSLIISRAASLGARRANRPSYAQEAGSAKIVGAA